MSNALRLKVFTIVGTRPEIIRLARVMARLSDFCDHSLIHTGQNYDYELGDIFFKQLNLEAPAHVLKCVEGSSSSVASIGNILISVDALLETHRPDAVLILGDTNSGLSVIAAKRRKIPIFHFEAGNRCFDMRVPEEINRRIIDHTADINLTYSSLARENLIREGLAPDTIINVGSPMREVIEYYQTEIVASNVLHELGLVEKKYFLVSAHREENVDDPNNLLRLWKLLTFLAEGYGLPVIVSTHPRTRRQFESGGFLFPPNVCLAKPFGYFDYMALQINARVTLSDSGSVFEEASILDFPAMSLRETHERSEAMEEAAVIMVGLNIDRVRQALTILDTQVRGGHETLKLVSDYGRPNVSEKIVRIIHSYVDYVNRLTWKKTMGEPCV